MDGGGDSLREIGELFERQFPDFACLRCRHDRFLVIANPEPAPEGMQVARLAQYGELAIDRAAFASGKGFDRPSHFAKVVCKRCGFTEDHFLPALALTDQRAKGESGDV